MSLGVEGLVRIMSGKFNNGQKQYGDGGNIDRDLAAAAQTYQEASQLFKGEYEKGPKERETLKPEKPITPADILAAKKEDQRDLL